VHYKNIVEKEPKLFIESDDNIDNRDILLASNWKNTKAFKEIQDKETQIKYYKKIQAQKAINLIKKYNNFMYQQIPQI
jgi:hypothetical protein